MTADRANWDDEPSAADAWKLMIYVCDDCGHKEKIWNARPHVTPFGGVACEQCHGASGMTHQFFGSDQYVPDHEPQAGDLIFIDIPPEVALIYAKRRIKQGIEAGYPIPEDKTFDDFAKELAMKDLEDFGGHSPYCIRLKR